MEEHAIVGLVNTSSGLLFMLFSIPLSRRKIKMNDWYGFRSSKAFQSEENWYAINEYGAKKLYRWSLVTVLTGILAILEDNCHSLLFFLLRALGFLSTASF